jgi:hypothetical protein
MHRGLRVLIVEVAGTEVRVDVYGGREAVCGTVLYEMADALAARRRAATLRRWARRGTPVTYVRNGTSASLVDEEGFLSSRSAGTSRTAGSN